MRIGLVSSYVPHVNGGYRFIVDWLEPRLRAAGHAVERIYVPNGGGATDYLLDMVAFRMLDLTHSCDRIITFRPPAHALRHVAKVVWFIHHERVFYDLWNSEYCPFPANAYWTAYRDKLRRADTLVLQEAAKVFTNSRVVQSCLRNFNGVEAEVLYPPIGESQAFYHQGVGDEVISVCRMEHHKRQHLMVEAMVHVTTPVRLRLVGPSASSDYVSALRDLIIRHHLVDRVSLDTCWINEDQKRALLSTALCAVYLPLDEDSYGYPTLEAAHAEHCTVTMSDSGGTLEFVEDGVSGLVVPPEPRALAGAFDELWSDRNLARRLELGASERARALKIDWDHVVRRLTA